MRNSFLLLLLVATCMLSCGGRATPPEEQPPAVITITPELQEVELRATAFVSYVATNCALSSFSINGVGQPTSGTLAFGSIVADTSIAFTCIGLDGKGQSKRATITVKRIPPIITLLPLAMPPAWLNSTLPIQATTQNTVSCVVELKPNTTIGAPNTVFPRIEGDPCALFGYNPGTSMPQEWTPELGVQVQVKDVAHGVGGMIQPESLTVFLAARAPVFDSLSPNPFPSGVGNLDLWVREAASTNNSIGTAHNGSPFWQGTLVGFFPGEGITNPGQFLSPTHLQGGFGTTREPGDSVQFCLTTQASAGVGGGTACRYLKIGPPLSGVSGVAGNVTYRSIAEFAAKLRQGRAPYAVDKLGRDFYGPPLPKQ